MTSPHPLRAAPRLAVAALASALLAAAPAARAELVVCPGDWEREVVDRINQERASAGAAPVALDIRLVRSARRHSLDMAAQNFLGHTGSDGSTPGQRVRQAGYAAYGGETAGAGHRSPAEIVAGWMASSGHRAILLDARNLHVGVGYARDGGDWIYGHAWTANFGRLAAPALGLEGHCSGPPGCSDGVDNDGDGRVDALDDIGCAAAGDLSEEHACADGLDNDGDGLVDHVSGSGDPQCAAAGQWSESDPNCGLGFELAAVVPALARLRERRRRGRLSSPR